MAKVVALNTKNEKTIGFFFVTPNDRAILIECNDNKIYNIQIDRDEGLMYQRDKTELGLSSKFISNIDMDEILSLIYKTEKIETDTFISLSLSILVDDSRVLLKNLFGKLHSIMCHHLM